MHTSNLQRRIPTTFSKQLLLNNFGFQIPYLLSKALNEIRARILKTTKLLVAILYYLRKAALDQTVFEAPAKPAVFPKCCSLILNLKITDIRLEFDCLSHLCQRATAERIFGLTSEIFVNIVKRQNFRKFDLEIVV